MAALPVIVWAHANDYGKHIPYPPEVSNEIEKIFSASDPTQSGKNSAQSVPLGVFCPFWTGYHINFATMKQCQDHSGRRFDVKRFIQDEGTAPAQGVIWEFEGDMPSHWSVYDLSMMWHMEKAYVKMTKSKSKLSKKKQSLLDMQQLLNVPWTINLDKMVQTRVDTGNVRNIQRRPLTQPYTQDTSGSAGSVLATNTSSLGAMTRSQLKKRKTTQATGGAALQAKPLGSTGAAQQKQHKSGPMSAISMTLEGAAAQEREPLPIENYIRITTQKTKPKSVEEMLEQYMTPVNLEEEEDGDSTEEGDEEEEAKSHDCCICCDRLSSPSAYGEDEAAGDASAVVKLKNCGHRFHHLCLLEMCRAVHKNECVQCPSCKMIYGEKTGICPAGVMRWDVLKGTSVAGYGGYNTISVSYDIRPGVQGPEHPNPGQQFYTQGFPRVGYLPDTDQGRKVLKMLIEAWRRRLMFTVGTSYTTGSSNVVTWNEIHHKTELYGNYSGHGYPDPMYLANVILELTDHGVTSDCL